jgi:hypothetical protein
MTGACSPPCGESYILASATTAPVVRKLGDLPDADMEIAVARVDRSTGCSKPMIVAYKVSR